MRTKLINGLAALALSVFIFPAHAGWNPHAFSLSEGFRPFPLASLLAVEDGGIEIRSDTPNSSGTPPFSSYHAPINRILLAHAILVKSTPEKESTITDAPDEVLLIFNDSVGQEFLALAVIDPSGKRVDNHDAKLDFTDHSHLRASVSKLAPGRYTVRYRVLSADGHVVTGKYFFDVKAK